MAHSLCTFPSDNNTPTITVTYVGVNGLAAQSAGTPTGTITGGGGGGPAVEVANATDLKHSSKR
jgi:pectate lyase